MRLRSSSYFLLLWVMLPFVTPFVGLYIEKSVRYNGKEQVELGPVGLRKFQLILTVTFDRPSASRPISRRREPSSSAEYTYVCI